MPIVRIAVLEGSSESQRRDMIAKVTDAVVESLSVQPAAVRVLIEDIAAQNWGVAGVSLKDREAK
jgi:4-oxalocrotonate tautomerase